MPRINHANEWAVLGAALDAFNALETRMEDVICAHLAPRADRVEFLRSQILHNSSLPFGAKVRVVLSVARDLKVKKLSRDKFHRALSIRNALAHGDSRRHVRENRNALRQEPIGEFIVVRAVSGDGRIEERPKSVAIAELMSLLEILGGELTRLQDAIVGGRDAV